MNPVDSRLTRIGIFYDGNFFYHVSNYYYYHHERHAHISIEGLHSFIRDQVARLEETNPRLCQIVDAHYFRGRLRAADAQDRNLLFKERAFEDVLIREGVVTHYLPLSADGEKGIDVWLALEAFELTHIKHFNVVVLIVCDGDYLPLVRKLNTLGARVMVLAWDFKYKDINNRDRETRTAQVLLDEATYPVMMHPIIDDRARRNDPLIHNLFVPRREPPPVTYSPGPMAGPPDAGPVVQGTIHNLRNGFGFIAPEAGGDNIFFFHQEVLEPDFLSLRPGDRVEYVSSQNDRGPCARRVRRLGGPREEPGEPTTTTGEVGPASRAGPTSPGPARLAGPTTTGEVP